MSKTAKRMLLATLSSLSGFAITFIWYRLSDTSSLNDANSKPIARLVSTVNEVQKKSVKKIIWQQAQDNEILRVGEAIRTSADSEARIEFLNSTTAINLEPDSAIVLDENDGQLALEFLSGNISVNAESSDAKGSPQLTLVSGGKKIALGKSELTLGKTASGELDVNILKGQIDGLESTNNKIKILRPLSGEPVYVNSAVGELATFEWQPLPAGYEVHLEVGSTRNTLAPVEAATGAGEKGQLKAKVAIGKSYFQLKAVSSQPNQPELISPVMRTNVFAKIAPQPLSPEKDSVLSVSKNEPEIQFLWSNPAQYSKVILEIATTPDLKNKLKTEYLKDTNQYTFFAERAATIYWRVSGVIAGSKEEIISSPIQSFKFSVLDSLLPPKLEWPRNNEKIQLEIVKRAGLTLSWQSALGAAKYRLIVEEIPANSDRKPAAAKKVFEGEEEVLQASLKDLHVGQYTWAVAAINSKDEPSPLSEKRTFYVQKLPILEWADGKKSADYFYITLKPSLSLEWQKGDTKATNWILSAYPAGDEKNIIRKKVTSPSFELELPANGLYLAEVEAYDDKGTILARSVQRAVKVAPAPLLPPPAYASQTPKEIEATGNGTAQVAWGEVRGAHQYILVTKSVDGTTKEYNFTALEAALKGLMPGEYKISLRSVDKTGRAGPLGEERIMKVPNQSNMRAPKLKGLKIK